MSYSDKTLQGKLKSLDETQATIVSISEWMLFHYRNSEQSIKTWAEYTINSSSGQKLPLFYLANEIVQKAKAKKREEISNGFASVLPSVLRAVYPRLDPKIQAKYKRVLDIWRDREIFEKPVLEKLYDAMKTKVAEKRSSTPPAQRSITDMAPELIPLSSAYNRLSHSSSLFSSNHLKFESGYKELFDNDYNLPAPDIFISKLNKLSQLNTNSKNSLNDIITIRESLIRDLNRVITSQTELIRSDKAKLDSLAEKGEQVVFKKKELEEYVNGEGDSMNVDDTGAAEDDDDEDEAIPTYANSDSEDESSSPAKKRKVDLEEETNGQDKDDDEDEEASPAYDKDSDSDSDNDIAPKTTINPNLASLLSKLSE